MMVTTRTRKGTRTGSANGATLGFEQTLWAAADKLRGHLDAAEYKHVVLGGGRMASRRCRHTAA